MIRRRKRQIFKELPAKVRAILPLEIDLKTYREGVKELQEWLRKNMKDNPAKRMVQIEKLKQVIALPQDSKHPRSGEILFLE